MAKYIIEDGIAEIEVVKGTLVSIYLCKRIRVPTHIRIPPQVGRQTIKKIGDGKKTIFKTYGEEGRFKFSSSRLSLSFSEKITDVEAFAFSSTSLNKLDWPKACDRIPHHCFYDTAMNSLTGIENVITIEQMAFYLVKNLYQFKIPNACIMIGSKAFANSEILEVTGGDNVNSIGGQLFQSSSIETFKWFPNVETIPVETFCDCRRLKTVFGIKNVASIERRAFFASGIESITWPDRCPIVPSFCFCDCNNLSQVLNTDQVEEIKDYAFCRCGNLRDFNFSSSLYSISNGAFSKTMLQKADLSSTMIEYINNTVFEDSPCCNSWVPSVGCYVDTDWKVKYN